MQTGWRGGSPWCSLYPRGHSASSNTQSWEHRCCTGRGVIRCRVRIPPPVPLCTHILSSLCSSLSRPPTQTPRGPCPASWEEDPQAQQLPPSPRNVPRLVSIRGEGLTHLVAPMCAVRGIEEPPKPPPPDDDSVALPLAEPSAPGARRKAATASRRTAKRARRPSPTPPPIMAHSEDPRPAPQCRLLDGQLCGHTSSRPAFPTES